MRFDMSRGKIIMRKFNEKHERERKSEEEEEKDGNLFRGETSQRSVVFAFNHLQKERDGCERLLRSVREVLKFRKKIPYLLESAFASLRGRRRGSCLLRLVRW